jgi:hypothetical protein
MNAFYFVAVAIGSLRDPSPRKHSGFRDDMRVAFAR